MNETLITLKLGRNGIRDEGVRELGQVLNSTDGASFFPETMSSTEAA